MVSIVHKNEEEISKIFFKNSEIFTSSQEFSSIENIQSIENAKLTNLSNIERILLQSTEPIESNESEEISWNEFKGIWLNKSEYVDWKGTIPVENYSINQDENPEIITKKSKNQMEYIQELAIRYLSPPTPPPPGDIIINQEKNFVAPPAPPIIIRQQPPRAESPQPLILREAPPTPPQPIGKKIITIHGKNLPPPPRKVIIERLAPLPSKPQSVLVERWLPYTQQKRRVIYNKPIQADPVLINPRNVIIQWETPDVKINHKLTYLGIVKANPVEYVNRYGNSLKKADELPEVIRSIKPPADIILASEKAQNTIHELYGDIEALKLVDLEKEGLSEYKNLIYNLQSEFDDDFIENIFNKLDVDKTSQVEFEDAKNVFIKMKNIHHESESLENAEKIQTVNQKLDLVSFKKFFRSFFK